MNFISGITMGILLGSVLVGAWVLFKTRDPDPEKERQRGYDDAKHFHTKKGLGVWPMEGYVKTSAALGRSGPYEEGMQQYVNEVLKR